MTDYRIYNSADKGHYVITPDDPAQTIRGDLSDILSLWARLDRFVRDQTTDGALPLTDPRSAGADILDMTDALELAEAQGHPIAQRTLRYNLDAGNIPGAEKPRGRWQIPRGHFLEWLNNRG
jgi:hypothetical protein